MFDLPDAPWIREAELNGPPEPEPVYCPICDEECDEIYFDRDGNEVGCNVCISTQDAGDWAYEKAEAAREAWVEREISERRDSGKPWLGG